MKEAASASLLPPRAGAALFDLFGLLGFALGEVSTNRLDQRSISGQANLL
jgi:hypothetical protein